MQIKELIIKSKGVKIVKKKQVYLFACIEKNIGDDLFIYAVAQRYPQIDFIISSDADYLNVNKIKNLKYSKIMKIWLKLSNNSSDNCIKRNIISIVEKAFRIFIKKLDSIYIVGNAFKNMNYKGFYQIKWIERRIKISKKFYLISTNYGPTNNGIWEKDCKKVFSKMTDVCFRDMKSYELFKNLKNVRYAPDAVISIDVKKHNNSNKNKYIIISVIDCKMKSRSKNINNIATSYEDKIISLINSFNDEGIGVVLLNSNTTQDEPASKRIYNNCIKKDMISIYNYDGNLNGIFNLFECAKGIIATRLHTIILAWKYDIPVIPIVYDIKVENLLNSYCFNENKWDILDINKIDYYSVSNSIKNYNFNLSKQLVSAANKQFLKIDVSLNKFGKNK